MNTIKKHTLRKVDCDYSIYSIIGIKSLSEDYKLVHHLNQTLGLDFVRITDFIQYFTQENEKKATKKSAKTQNMLELFDSPKLEEEIPFPTFCFEDDVLKLSYLLLKNNISNHYLIEEKQNADYLFIVFNKENYFDKKVSDKIKLIPIVDALYKIETKAKHLNLFEEIEEHILYFVKKSKEEYKKFLGESDEEK